MRTFLIFASGFILCLILGIGIPICQKLQHPLSPVTNQDYSLVQVLDEEGPKYELHKGESKLLPYGWYTITVPDAKASFRLFKNNRGTCTIRSTDGILVVEVDENASIMPPIHASDQKP